MVRGKVSSKVKEAKDRINRLQCAGYVLYSSATNLVLTVGEGVYGFTLDPLVGEFVLSHNDIKIPPKGKIYSFNEGNYGLWDDATTRTSAIIDLLPPTFS